MRSTRARSSTRITIGSGILLSILALAASPAWASDEILEVNYPHGEVNFTELAPGDTQVHHATVSNTTDTDLELLVTSNWAQTSAAEAGVDLTAEACNQAWQGSSCPGETLDIALSDGASTFGTARGGEQWDVRFVAMLPADAGNETQGLSSTFTVDFAISHATDGDPTEDHTAPPDGQGSQETPDAQDIKSDAQDFASEAPDESGSIKVTQSSGDDTTTTQDDGDSSLAITGANLWALIALSVALALAGSALVWWKRRTAQRAEEPRGSA